jgi:phage shock protein A
MPLDWWEYYEIAGNVKKLRDEIDKMKNDIKKLKTEMQELKKGK